MNLQKKNAIRYASKLFDEMPRRSLQPVFLVNTNEDALFKAYWLREFFVHLNMIAMLAFDLGGRVVVIKTKRRALNWSEIECHDSIEELVLFRQCMTLSLRVRVDAPNLFDKMPGRQMIFQSENKLARGLLSSPNVGFSRVQAHSMHSPVMTLVGLNPREENEEKMEAEFYGFLLQSKSFALIVFFYLGGECEWLRFSQ